MKPSFFDREVKIKTPEEMFAKLQQRTAKLNSGGSGDRSEAVPSADFPNAAAPTPLIWQTPVTHGDGSGFMLSTCGRFSIVKEKAPGAFVYRLFSRDPPAILLSTHPDLKSAQKAANEAS
jgi:hypothetical protein